MHALKHPSFFRPTSRPSSPAPLSPSATSSPRLESGLASERSRTVNRLSLSNFRRPSPALSAAPIPTLIQDGSYLEVLNLKLSEAVSKALAQPAGSVPSGECLFGKRPIPTGRGYALGALIASWVSLITHLAYSHGHFRELKAAQDSPHLHRAILRSLQRPLSVLLTNLSAHLLPLISSTLFLSPPAPTVQASSPNPTQLHALAIAGFAGELLETFDSLDLGQDADQRGDGLKLIRDGLVSLGNRVVGPLIAGIRNELMPVLDALEVPSSQMGSRPVTGTKSPIYHPSIITLQAVMPIYARALTRYTVSTSSQTTLATFLISVIWRGLVALSHRPYMVPSPPASPGFSPLAPKKSPGSTPPLTPPGRFTIKLPPSRPPSRPPSPPSLPIPATTAADARALYNLLTILPCPRSDKDTTRLAREVVDDAFEGLRALPPLLDTVFSRDFAKVESQCEAGVWARKLQVLTTELPLLIALPVLLQGNAHGGPVPSVAHLLGLSEDDYRNECLYGFGRAEECSTPIALQLLNVMHMDNANPLLYRYLELEIAEATDLDR